MRSIVKVPAHTGDTPGETQQTRMRRLGNAWADACAKKGAQLHPDFQPRRKEFFKRQWFDAKVSCKLLAAASATWPAAAAMVSEPRRPPTREGRCAQADANRAKRNDRRRETRQQQQKSLDTHIWVNLGTTRRCAICMQWCAAKMCPCRGSPAGLAEWRSQAADRARGALSPFTRCSVQISGGTTDVLRQVRGLDGDRDSGVQVLGDVPGADRGGERGSCQVGERAAS